MTAAPAPARRDVVHAGGGAVAEIDADGNIYELHCDHLGSPRHVTSGATGAVVGEQAFGPYGERIVGTFNGKAFPSGYRPATGWTGHLDEDPTGLVYMRGRYYSPLWHRFVSSDRGADPNGLNQFAYVGGSPFTATDPSGMEWVLHQKWHSYWTHTFWVNEDGTRGELINSDFLVQDACGVPSATVDINGGGGGSLDPWRWYDPMRGGYGYGGGGGFGGGGGGPAGGAKGPNTPKGEKTKTDCERYAEALAESALAFRNKYPFTGGIRFGVDLYGRANTNIANGSFGLAPTYTGFKDRLVNMGQRSGVYRHVSAALGVSMQWGGGPLGMAIPFGRTLLDELPDYYLGNNPEAMPEAYGNIAGALLAPDFNYFFDVYPNKELLVEKIKKALCKK